MKPSKQHALAAVSQRVAQALPEAPPLHGGSPAPRHKTLYLVRHAKSRWSDPSQQDFDRKLNKRGQHDAPEMGRRLGKRNVQPDVILCSPAQRTRQTADLLLERMGGPINNVEYVEGIYDASIETLLDIIKELPDNCSRAMLIGHNPSIGCLVNQFSEIRIQHMPTCAVATIELSANHWNEAGHCPARLLDFDYPKRAPKL